MCMLCQYLFTNCNGHHYANGLQRYMRIDAQFHGVITNSHSRLFSNLKVNEVSDRIAVSNYLNV